ncbi:DNA repair protein RecN [Pusillimonas noertemannii]|uniref:DNA repair protein RecN n=1 Tax=Pusillimonas noertemannii TaxID=305977 RepID=A0A2U1CRJ9_9BURK|nr:DNA repair protein RecN [Pusillimonas noertemannii]NYT67862.1 DNA repair protein RecN [Pusillimonas noertemannii]PVY68532.1 DNA replication and repair protein RecN [Pusillimonas noertemannii]TFL11993.1 DNA repair protein RecN [Pusillimonas noertemannii]
MLRSLHIHDFVIVDKAEIQFESGFTVFSGETGAGKSILIDALSLALGARGDAAAIREGASRTDISAVFDAPTELRQALAEQSFDPDDALVLRRVIDGQGRSRAYINGVPATLAQLKQLGEALVDIHGQHAHQSLARPASQRDMLDAQGGHQQLARDTQQAWQQWQQSEKLLHKARDNHEALQQERERLEWQIGELQRLDPGKDEWEALSASHNRLAHAQALLQGATQALAALDNDEASVQHFLGAALHQLQPLLRHDTHLQGICEALESARIAAGEAASDLNSYLDRLELDPDALAQAERRLSALFEAARQFKVEPEALPELLQTLQAQLAETDVAGDLDALAEQVRQAQARYNELARQLGAARKKAAKKLSVQVSEAMQTLAMQGGRFEVALQAAPPSAHGLETIEFLVAGHGGVTPRPLAKVASGGELARLSLALSVIASQAARVPTLIFDEVDTGVGGAVAEVVGRLLRQLGARHQVLCVTHLPQVAACGDHHYEVSKTTQQGATLSQIQLLGANGRVDEIARMLGGLKITDTTRKHAREMLAP